jgi:hypothetical protein
MALDLRGPWAHHPVYLTIGNRTELLRDEILDAAGGIIIRDVSWSTAAPVVAAGSDLLDVARMVDAWGNGLRHHTAHESKMVKAARAAISKAEGQL